MGILIDTVRISNFRSLKNVELKLSKLTLLAGANNAGKTSFLKALNIVFGTERRNIVKEDFHIGAGGGGDIKEINIDVLIFPVNDKVERVEDFSALWRDVTFGDLISFDGRSRQFVAFRTQISYNSVKNDYEIRKYKIDKWKEDLNGWETIEYKNPLRNSFPTIPLFLIDAQRDILEDLRSRTSYLGRLLSKIEIAPKIIKALEQQIKELNKEIIGSSEVLTHLKEGLNELSKTILSGSSGVDISPINKRVRDLNRGLNINFQDGKNESFPLEYHGMGTRSWASLLTFKAYNSWLSEKFEEEGTTPYHPVLALEEPEAHLHPNAQRHLYSQLINIPGQKIISSHSPYIAGQCSISDVRHFYKTDDNPQISSFNTADLTKEDIRKLEREIMHSRGELLFSRVIVLFEGETEEQSLPMFAKEYWDSHPFETGISFVGVGGHGNYLPFIRFCQSFKIPWYIFSDGEDEARKSLEKSLTKIGLNLSQLKNIRIIPNKNSYEQFLVSEGYQKEIKEAIVQSLDDQFHNEKHKAAKTAEIMQWNDTDLLKHLIDNKTSICCHVAEKILSSTDKAKRFPSTVRTLLDQISKDIGVKIATKHL